VDWSTRSVALLFCVVRRDYNVTIWFFRSDSSPTSNFSYVNRTVCPIHTALEGKYVERLCGRAIPLELRRTGNVLILNPRTDLVLIPGCRINSRWFVFSIFSNLLDYLINSIHRHHTTIPSTTNRRKSCPASKRLCARPLLLPPRYHPLSGREGPDI
jgi:hypothetical protein